MFEVQKFIKSKKISKKHSKDQEQSDYIISSEVRKMLPEIIKKMETEWMGDWERLQRKPPMDEVDSFGTKIRNGGEEYQFEFLINLGNQIIQAIQAFDIEQIRKHISEFPNVMDKVRKMQ